MHAGQQQAGAPQLSALSCWNSDWRYSALSTNLQAGSAQGGQGDQGGAEGGAEKKAARPLFRNLRQRL